MPSSINPGSSEDAGRYWKQLSEAAWKCRANARILEKTKVGAAALSNGDELFVGCNVEHRFRSHDIHAEVNAIGSMIASGNTELKAILVVAERKLFTPCGACMDWIFEFGGKDCLVGFQSKEGGDIRVYDTNELMPHYPC